MRAAGLSLDMSSCSLLAMGIRKSDSHAAKSK